MTLTEDNTKSSRVSYHNHTDRALAAILFEHLPMFNVFIITTPGRRQGSAVVHMRTERLSDWPKATQQICSGAGT